MAMASVIKGVLRQTMSSLPVLLLFVAALGVDPILAARVYGERGLASHMPCDQEIDQALLQTVTWNHKTIEFYKLNKAGQKTFHQDYANRMKQWGTTGMEIVKTRLEDEGNYTCRITDTSGKTTGTNVELLVSDNMQGNVVVRITKFKHSASEGEFVSYTSDSKLPPGSVVVVHAWATSYKPPAGLVWTRNGVRLNDTAEASVTNVSPEGYGDSQAILEYTIVEEDETVSLASVALGPKYQEWARREVALAAYHEDPNSHVHTPKDGKTTATSSLPFIIGAAVALVLLIIIIILLVILILRMRRQKKHPITTSNSRPTSADMEGQEGEEMKPLKSRDREDGAQVKVTRHPSYRKNKPQNIKKKGDKGAENNNAAAENTQ